MKSVEYLAGEFARNWTKPELSIEAQDALSHAYLTGFNRARSEMAGMFRQLNNPHAVTLVEALHTVEVDPETGERWDELGKLDE